MAFGWGIALVLAVVVTAAVAGGAGLYYGAKKGAVAVIPGFTKKLIASAEANLSTTERVLFGELLLKVLEGV